MKRNLVLNDKEFKYLSFMFSSTYRKVFSYVGILLIGLLIILSAVCTILNPSCFLNTLLMFGVGCVLLYVICKFEPLINSLGKKLKKD